jgi:ABC-type branched-subunit amino acid transport system substrate-binding protein
MNAKQWMLGGLCAAFALMVDAASAQIRIGQTTGITGTVAASVGETVLGAKLWIDAVNAKGGVNGQAIELVTLDDKFDPKLAAENAKKLITENNVQALFLTRGTPHNEAIMPLLTQYKIPMIAPSTGAMVLHKPVNPYIFNVRATYQREAERAVTHLATLNVERIGVIAVNDSFGADSLEGVNRGFTAAKREPVFSLRFDRVKPEFAELVKQAQVHNPQAIVFVGSGAAMAEGVKAARAAGVRAQFVTLSNNASGGFAKLLGDYAAGTVVTQVFPPERNTSIKIIRELTELAQAKGVKDVSPAMVEGFAAAKVLTEALARAGKDVTAESITRALNGLRKFDLGGMEISFSPTDHTGINYVDISILDGSGKFRR